MKGSAWWRTLYDLYSQGWYNDNENEYNSRGYDLGHNEDSDYDDYDGDDDNENAGNSGGYEDDA